MSAIKEYYHDLIESHNRLYDILQLQAMKLNELVEIAADMNITVGEANHRQNLIYKILEKQSEKIQ